MSKSWLIGGVLASLTLGQGLTLMGQSGPMTGVNPGTGKPADKTPARPADKAPADKTPADKMPADKTPADKSPAQTPKKETTGAAAPDPKTTAPKAKPFDEAKVNKLLEYMDGEYEKLFASRDWVVRSLSVISIARFPNAKTTARLMDIMRKDPHMTVRITAWEGMLARVKIIDAEVHSAWVHATIPLLGKGIDNGRLRIGLLRMMQTAAPMKPFKDSFLKMVREIDLTIPGETQVLVELGKTLGAWKSPDLVDQLLKLTGGNVRAAQVVGIILNSAGCPLSNNAKPEEQAAWWKKERPNWKEITIKPDGETWTKLKPNILAAPITLQSIDPSQDRWRKELEIRRPNLKNFDISFVVDVSGSMSSSLQWLRRDMSVMANVLYIFAPEPRFGVVFYSGPDFNIQSQPLTSKLDQVQAALAKMQPSGGGEEQNYGAMVASVNNNPWPTKKDANKVVVMVSDEEIVPGQTSNCEKTAREMVSHGFRIYSVCPDPKVPNTFVKLAELGNGTSFGLGLPRGVQNGEIKVEPPMQEETVSVQFITRIIADSITPEYRERVAPLVSITYSIHSVRGGN